MHHQLTVLPDWLWGLGLVVRKCRCDHCRGVNWRWVGFANWVTTATWWSLSALVFSIAFVAQILYVFGDQVDAWLRARFGSDD